MAALENISADPPAEETKRPLKIDLSAWIFWITFVLSFLIDRVLVIATLGRYRIGAVIFFLGLVLLLSRLRVVNRQLLAGLAALGIVGLLSAIINHSTITQTISFLRIPITVYLVYFVVSAYFVNQARVKKIFRLMYFIALFQLPILVVQRLAYPIVPARIKFGSITGQLASVDFGMGSFNGDAPMSYFLISLLILLLFYDQRKDLVRYKWFMAVWMTLTVIVGNSQIQHLLIVGVWLVYFLTHLKIKTILAIAIGVVILAATVNYLDQSGILTFSPLQHTRARATKIFSTSGRQERIDLFLSGYHARDGAIYYYMREPINWIGDGPGRYYNTVTRERTLGSWGHLFTFYAEVGLIGWAISMLVFFIIAFPLSIEKSKVTVPISWVQALMFLSVLVVSVARYPMNTIPMIFTYCVILLGYRIIAQQKQLRII